MCLMLQSVVYMEREENDVDYFRVTQEVLQSFLHQYYHCSARLVYLVYIMNNTLKLYIYYI